MLSLFPNWTLVLPRYTIFFFGVHDKLHRFKCAAVWVNYFEKKCSLQSIAKKQNTTQFSSLVVMAQKIKTLNTFSR